MAGSTVHDSCRGCCCHANEPSAEQSIGTPASPSNLSGCDASTVSSEGPCTTTDSRPLFSTLTVRLAESVEPQIEVTNTENTYRCPAGSAPAGSAKTAEMLSSMALTTLAIEAETLTGASSVQANWRGPLPAPRVSRALSKRG
eukprot:scaffold663897_cov41-Prasinocladus_malaysianus.AAC.1